MTRDETPGPPAAGRHRGRDGTAPESLFGSPAGGAPEADRIRTLVVVGVGAIGTSVGLAARAAGVEVLLIDPLQEHVELAAQLGAGRPWRASSPLIPADHVVVCAPPALTGAALIDAMESNLGETFSDTASVKAGVLLEVETSGAPLSRYVGGHPMAGSERAGPASARADLFVGRPWVLTPTAGTAPEALARATELALLCGADPVVRTPAEHDRAVAAVSHLPQLVASALAATLARLSESDVVLAGQGVRDMTRIADSDPRLWAQIGVLNAREVRLALERFVDEVGGVRAALAAVAGDVRPRDAGAAVAAVPDSQPVEGVAEAIEALIEQGNAGRRRLPAKHGVPAPDVATITVTVADRPGELARILTALAESDVNLEDLAVDHAPGAAAGLAYLTVTAAMVERALAVLGRGGWTARLG